MRKISLYFAFVAFILLACTSVQTFLPTQAPTPSQTSTVIPTEIVVPAGTFDPENGPKLVKYLLENNAGCELPCWWGITPGVTLWKQARQILEKTSVSIDAQESQNDFKAEVETYLPDPYDFAPSMKHVYGVKNGVVHYIRVYNFDLAPRYDLQNFLQTYGQPTEVWMRTFAQAELGAQDFLIELFYREQGMLIEYRTAKLLKEIDGKLQNCLIKEMNSPIIHLWSSDVEDLTFEEAKGFIDTANLPEPKPLLDATGMDVETFYETFQDPETEACLQTPRKLWP